MGNHTSTKPGQPMSFLRMVVSGPDVDVCVVWPHSKSQYGYGIVRVGGRLRHAHRVALSMLTGEPYDTPLLAAHGPCHNRSCVNPHPSHGMKWATYEDNAADKVRDGTHIRGAQNSLNKLSIEDVLKIREDPRTHGAIAADFGVVRPTVTNIKARKRWAWL